MTMQIAGIPPIYKLNNHNGLNQLTSLLSIEDRGNLRACSKMFKSEISDIPLEAKTFLVFESKLPIIRALIRKIELYRNHTNSSARTYREMRAGFMLYPLKFLFILPGPILGLLAGEKIELIFLYSLPLITIVTLVVAIIVKDLYLREIKKHELRNLWQEYQNQTLPLDVIEDGRTLIDRLRDHETFSVLYTEAGGMDQLYHTAGLDYALAEIRDRRR